MYSCRSQNNSKPVHREVYRIDLRIIIKKSKSSEMDSIVSNLPEKYIFDIGS
jgi:hypothetical protein